MRLFSIALGLFLYTSSSWAQTCSDSSYWGYISQVVDLCERMQANSGPINCSTPESATNSKLKTVDIGSNQYLVCYSDLCSGDTKIWSYSQPLPDCARNLKAIKSASQFYNTADMCGSIVKVDNEVLGEAIPIVGASFNLNYFSNYARRITDYKLVIPPNDLAPSNVQALNVTISTSLPTLQNVNYTSRPATQISYVWNGNNASGNPMFGTLLHKVQVNEDRSFTSWTSNIPFTSSFEIYLGTFNAKLIGLGGFVPSNYAFYDYPSKTLFFGNGSFRKIAVELSTSNLFIVPTEDGSLVYEFDSQGILLRIRLGFTGTVVAAFNYDSSKRLTSVQEPFSKFTYFNRNGSGDLVSIVAPNGKTTSVTLDANGFLTSVSNPSSETYQMTYNVRGLMLTFQKPNLAVSTFTYDADDKLIKDEHAAGNFLFLETIQNTLSGKIQNVSTKMGRVTTIENQYNGKSDRKIYYPDGTYEHTHDLVDDGNQSWRYKYLNNYNYSTQAYTTDTRFSDKSKYVSSDLVDGKHPRNTTYSQNYTLNNTSDPFSINTWTRTATTNNSTNILSYTGATQTFIETSHLGRTRTYKWDSYQRPTYIQQGSLTPVIMTYTNDKLTAVSEGSRVSNLTYHPTFGLVTSIQNPYSQTTQFSYDNSERLQTITFPDLRVVNFSYNAKGELSSITPAGRPVHSFSYNVAELIGGYSPPTLSGVTTVATSYTYNDDKQLTQIHRPDGQTINYTYDAITGRLNNLSTPDRVINYSYSTSNIRNNTVMMTYATGVTRVDFDGRDFKSSRVDFYSTSDYAEYSFATNTTGYGYVTSDQVNITGVPSTINYGYDLDELLTSAGSLTLAYTTPNGLLNNTTLGTVTDLYGRNTYGEITSYQGKVSGVNSYGYTTTRDDLGRVSSKTQTIPGVGTTTYGYVYDSSGRLYQVLKNGVLESTYGYDSNNNRTSGNIGTQTTTATYDDQDRVVSYNTFTYTYNANGDLQTKTNTLTSEVTQYFYDALGNLTKVILPNANVIEYEIDGLNRRVGKLLNGNLVKRYSYMDQYRINAEITPAGTLLRRYVYASKSNTPDYYIQAGVNYRIFSDHLGSPRMIVRASNGTIVCKQDHDEFGRLTLNTLAGCLPFGFAGGLYDEDTGLLRFGARDYDPTIGRWTTKDPIGFAGGDTNLYAYVGGDPMSYIDPSGLSQEQIDNALSWIGVNYPSLVQGINPKGYDLPLPSSKGGFTIPGTHKFIVDTSGNASNAWVLGRVVHELLHIKKGFLFTIFDQTDTYHEMIDSYADFVMEDYMNRSEQGSKKGGISSCPRR